VVCRPRGYYPSAPDTISEYAQFMQILPKRLRVRLSERFRVPMTPAPIIALLLPFQPRPLPLTFALFLPIAAVGTLFVFIPFMPVAGIPIVIAFNVVLFSLDGHW